jgi:hypothetical protein
MNDVSTAAIDLGRNEHVDLSETDRHALLASDRRRQLVRVLSEWNAPVGVSDLAVAVQRAEADSPESVEASTREISIELHHNHLPRLAAASLIDYVPQTHRVEAIRF